MNSHIIQKVAVSSIMIAALGAIYFSTATPAEALTLRRATSTTGVVTIPPATPRLDATCMGDAVELRETALMTAWSEYQASMTEALAERKADLVAAWDQDSAKTRTTALKTAWKEWKASSKIAHTELRKERKTAWDAFKKTAKSDCKMNLPQEEALEKTKSDTVAL